MHHFENDVVDDFANKKFNWFDTDQQQSTNNEIFFYYCKCSKINVYVSIPNLCNIAIEMECSIYFGKRCWGEGGAYRQVKG